jgi:hypothetical protein
VGKQGRMERKQYYTTWDDLDPWVEQVYAEHGYQTAFSIVMPAERHGLPCAVVMELTKPVRKPGDIALHKDYRDFDPRVQGAAEGAALMLISKAVMALDNELYQEKLRQPPLWDA